MKLLSTISNEMRRDGVTSEELPRKAVQEETCMLKTKAPVSLSFLTPVSAFKELVTNPCTWRAQLHFYTTQMGKEETGCEGWWQILHY